MSVVIFRNRLSAHKCWELSYSKIHECLAPWRYLLFFDAKPKLHPTSWRKAYINFTLQWSAYMLYCAANKKYQKSNAFPFLHNTACIESTVETVEGNRIVMIIIGTNDGTKECITNITLSTYIVHNFSSKYKNTPPTTNKFTYQKILRYLYVKIEC